MHPTPSSARHACRGLCACLLGAWLLAAGGCNFFILGAYLLGGPPTIEPDFDAQTKLSLSEKDRKVLVVCYAPIEVKWDFDAIDKELAKYLSYRLGQAKVKVIDPDVVQGWLDEHPNWDRPSEVGADLQADFVIFVELNTFTLYEESSSSLYRGQCDAMVSVYQMEDGDGSVIYSKEVSSKFPTLQPISTTEMSYYDFRRMYMSRLSEEIGWLFYEHFAGDEIPHGGL